MKINSTFRNLFSVFAMASIIAISSCTEEDDDNVINAPNGLTIDLSWTPDSGTNPDIDLDLNLAGLRVASSSSTTQGESIIIISDDPDGVYTVDVEYFSGNVDVNYTLVISGGGESRTFTGSFTAAEGQTPTNTFDTGVATITKDGDDYRVE